MQRPPCRTLANLNELGAQRVSAGGNSTFCRTLSTPSIVAAPVFPQAGLEFVSTWTRTVPSSRHDPIPEKGCSSRGRRRRGMSCHQTRMSVPTHSCCFNMVSPAISTRSNYIWIRLYRFGLHIYVHVSLQLGRDRTERPHALRWSWRVLLSKTQTQCVSRGQLCLGRWGNFRIASAAPYRQTGRPSRRQNRWPTCGTGQGNDTLTGRTALRSDVQTGQPPLPPSMTTNSHMSTE